MVTQADIDAKLDDLLRINAQRRNAQADLQSVQDEKVRLQQARRALDEREEQILSDQRTMDKEAFDIIEQLEQLQRTMKEEHGDDENDEGDSSPRGDGNVPVSPRSPAPVRTSGAALRIPREEGPSRSGLREPPEEGLS